LSIGFYAVHLLSYFTVRKIMPSFLEIYNKLTNLPFGRYLFDKDVGFVAPFFGKIHPHVIELKPSLCVVKMRDRWGIRNHIGTVNAGGHVYPCGAYSWNGGGCDDSKTSSMDTQKNDRGVLGEGERDIGSRM
jgi:hypothetical protein